LYIIRNWLISKHLTIYSLCNWWMRIACIWTL